MVRQKRLYLFNFIINYCGINIFFNPFESYHILLGKMKISVSILNLLIGDLQGKVMHHLYHTATWQIVLQFTH